MKITKIDKIACDVVRKELDKVLADFTKATGLDAKQGNITFDPERGSIKMRLELTVDGAETQREADARQAMQAYNIKSTATIGNETLEIVGYRGRANKPWIIKKSNGKSYIYDDDFVMKNFKEKDAMPTPTEAKLLLACEVPPPTRSNDE